MRAQGRSSLARALADAIGHTATVRLMRAYGGRRLYIPVAIPEEHPLAAVLGYRACRPLSERWGGERITIPDDQTALLDLRNRKIAEQYRAGEPIRSLARRYGLSPRMVRKVLDATASRHPAGNQSPPVPKRDESTEW
ncbi:MAG: Mor transcription activator family protein [Halomonas sp.]